MRVATYLKQARNTLTNFDASVLMSAAAIDAMLKDHKLVEGSLYKRIDEAVTAACNRENGGMGAPSTSRCQQSAPCR